MNAIRIEHEERWTWIRLNRPAARVDAEVPEGGGNLAVVLATV